MDKYLTDAKLRWAQEELRRKLQDAAERHKRLVILKREGGKVGKSYSV